jgi:hypothetical protein
MLFYRSKGLLVAEIWFDEPTEGIRADIIRYHQSQASVPDAVSTPFYTPVIDLAPAEKDIWKALQNNTSYEIRRARERDGVRCGVWDGVAPGFLSRFRSVYDAFARQKALPLLPWQGLQRLADARILDVSCASCAHEGDLVFHAHILACGRARLLYSASLFRNSTDRVFRALVGRANRLLHWEDMIRFKSFGFEAYDFGGWYDGNTDEEKLKINAFKEGFGGRIEKDFNAEVLISFKAKIFALVAQLVGRRR